MSTLVRFRELALVSLLVALSGGCGSAGLIAPSLPDAGVVDLETRSLLLLFADRRSFEPFVAQQAMVGSPALREALARFVGRSDLPEVGGTLESLRVDDVAEVRRVAVFGLGLLGYPEAKPALLASVAAADRREAVLAVEALSKLETPLSEVLLALLPLGEEERWLRLLPALYRFESPTLNLLAAKGWKFASLASGSAEARRGAAFVLSTQATPSDVETLRAMALDGDPHVRAWSVRGLGEVGDGAELPTVLARLDDADPRPRVAALGAVRRLVERGLVKLTGEQVGRLDGRIADRNASVRFAALASARAWLPSESTSTRLRRVLAGAPGAEAALALETLALTEADSSARDRLFSEAARSTVVELREAVARLGGAEYFETLSADSSARVRAAAYVQRLREASTGIDDKRGTLARGLTDLDAGVRAGLLEWLVGSPLLPFEPIEASLALARRDEIPDARLAAVRALVARARAEPLDRGAIVRRLERLAADPDGLVRREARAGLARLDRPSPPAGPSLLGRGGEVYRQIVQQTSRPRRVELRTTVGTLVVELPCATTPLNCLNFMQLVGRGFYDGLPVTRLVPGEWLETGDPRGDGRGGPGYTVRDEMEALLFDEGLVGMASTTPDGAGSRLLFALAPLPSLDGRLTPLGRVISGLETLRSLAPGDRIESAREIAVP